MRLRRILVKRRILMTIIMVALSTSRCFGAFGIARLSSAIRRQPQRVAPTKLARYHPKWKQIFRILSYAWHNNRRLRLKLRSRYDYRFRSFVAHCCFAGAGEPHPFFFPRIRHTCTSAQTSQSCCRDNKAFGAYDPPPTGDTSACGISHVY